MKSIPFLAKALTYVVISGGLAFGGYSYVKKNNPGVILGTTNFIEEKIPQSKKILGIISPTEEPLQEEEQNNEETKTDSSTDLLAENKFLKESLEMTKKQIEILSEKSDEVKEHLLNLSDEIKESSDGAALHEKALEYGQYVYCQQVVKEYQTN